MSAHLRSSFALRNFSSKWATSSQRAAFSCGHQSLITILYCSIHAWYERKTTVNQVIAVQESIVCSQISWHGQFCAVWGTWVGTFRSGFFVDLSSSWSSALRNWRGTGRRAPRHPSQNWRWYFAAESRGKTGQWRPAGPAVAPHQSVRKHGERRTDVLMCTRTTWGWCSRCFQDDGWEYRLKCRR